MSEVAAGSSGLDLSVYAKVAAHEAQLQEGVLCMHKGLGQRFAFGKAAGVKTRVSRDGRIEVDVAVVAQYGTDLQALGQAIRRAVTMRLGAMSNQPMGRVNVIIADIKLSKAHRDAATGE
jgi:uncharacterized alkaline shock family protein YloU